LNEYVLPVAVDEYPPPTTGSDLEDDYEDPLAVSENFEEEAPTSTVSGSSRSHGKRNRPAPNRKAFTHRLCTICGKMIKGSMAQLRVHMKTHTGDKPFQCGIFNKKRTHTGKSRISPSFVERHSSRLTV